MSNLLKGAMIDLIRSLHRQGISQRQIASELAINRETVARYLTQAREGSKPATVLLGSDGPNAATFLPSRLRRLNRRVVTTAPIPPVDQIPPFRPPAPGTPASTSSSTPSAGARV
jgi:hypothetical protein